MMPGTALASLMDVLAERGIGTRGMTLGRHSGALIPAGGQPIGYSCRLYWWPTGRQRHGRPVYTIHPVADPACAARRIARTRQEPGC